MLPTFKNGDVVCIKKYNLDLNRNDIIVARKNNKTVIKRLIGMPNDTIKIDNYVYVNGIKIDDLYIEDAGIANNEIKLKSNEYFVLGDNRQHSIDSRFSEVGIILENEIVGKVIK